MAALDLHCGTRDIYLWHVGSLVVAWELLVEACMRDLVPRPGIEPGPPALGVWSLTHWTTREVPAKSFYHEQVLNFMKCILYIYWDNYMFFLLSSVNMVNYTIWFLFYSYFIYLFIYLFWLCWVFGSCEGFLWPRQVGATLHRGAGTALHRDARASHRRGPSRCGAQAPDAQAQQLWPTGPAAPRHVGSSQTRARTRVPCISRQILNHCATREALISFLKIPFIMESFKHIKSK